MNAASSGAPLKAGQAKRTKPTPARLYDYYLNGVDHDPVDREAAERVRQMIPEVHYMATANRGCLQRAAGYMARAGINQFIDVGAGLPTQWNSHEVVHTVNPDAIVIYVDNDPEAVTDAKAILTARGETNAIYIQGDIREPASILDNPEVRDAIDFNQPIGQIHAAVWHFVSPEDHPYALMKKYVDAVPSGSHFMLSHVTSDGQRPDKVQRFIDVYKKATAQLYFRTWREIGQFFDGLQFIPPYEGADPSLSYCDIWGSKNPDGVDPSYSWLPAGVAIKP